MVYIILEVELTFLLMITLITILLNILILMNWAIIIFISPCGNAFISF